MEIATANGRNDGLGAGWASVKTVTPHDGWGYEWAYHRTLRLLPRVCELVAHEVALPVRLEVRLVLRRELAWEIGRLEAAASLPRTSGARYWLRRVKRARDARHLRTATWTWPAEGGGRRALVLLDLAHAHNELEWGALMAEGVMLAAMASQPGRDLHLSEDANEWAPSRYSLDKRIDLKGARLQAEADAARAAARCWREWRQQLGPAAQRADELLLQLDAGLTGPREPAESTAAWTLRLYDQLHPVTEVTKRDVHYLLGWISTHGTDTAATGDELAAERASILRAAAHADELALRAELNPADEDDPELADDAVALGWHLRDFDARWGTGDNVVPQPRDLSWETRSARDYTRAAWGAPHEQPDEK
jgi:hypothetical protein